MRPPSFEAVHALDWSAWVLEHGCLPEVVGVELPIGHSVPVAVWRGPTTAAVMHVRRHVEDDDPEIAPFTETDVHLFLRHGDDWTSAGGGGSGGCDVDVLIRADVHPRSVTDIGAETTADMDGRRCTAVSGVAGEAAASLEIERGGIVVRQPIVAPLGLFVASSDGDVFTVRVLDDDGRVLGEQHIDVDEQFR